MEKRRDQADRAGPGSRLTRRRLLRLALIGLAIPAGSSTLQPARGSEATRVLLPMAFGPASLPDGTLLAPASGTVAAAQAWFNRYSANYNPTELTAILAAYAELGEAAGLDWFLALAQNAHETAHLSSWWSAAPRRNPAGIGVTGETRTGGPDSPPGSDWAWDSAQSLWRRGLSFASWADEAVPAHLGRLLAYALAAGNGSAFQQQLIIQALGYRPLPADFRGVAQLITDLNGRWAVPGTTYGQSILELRNRMRSS